MIEFRDVSKQYPNGVIGLNHVTLNIEQGEFVAIIGLSGAGKSTMIRTINRMIDITGGQLVVDVEGEGDQVTNLYLTGPTNIVCKGEITDEEL